ncbi:response regulator [Photobacterium kishitanii]|uniref:DNA-binding response regulator n=1 Tax=Photobacterium kishitanii TaxID=318456 RepID=A0A0B7JHP2_9GAMM|nr:response regulator [Photobacterium kishitanii]KJG07652.1 transcriptional regulator [Photobacterium kishitanii]OBU33618.1 DNA-binding response regulator [Photobacterium kishitanii]PSU89513.1 DNA-binding response regulator [Photobacterium kishitanii]PSU93437.1 DNA-binding response regulator [Photobacterium kishitanii]PSV04837.1 DNA-binding response regulator [Photobacterium kishitanii]
MNNDSKILIIEDEAPIRRFLDILTTGHGYQVKTVETAQEGLKQITTWNPHLILLDLGLPDADGLDFTKELRSWTETPIIVISARDKEADKVLALDAGANDYLTKPFGSGELLARIRVALRINTNINSAEISQYQFGEVVLDLAMQTVTNAGEAIKLTPKEYKIFTLLAKNMGKVLTHKQILKEVWGGNYTEHAHYVRIHIAQLRHKIERSPAQPQYIITENGVGYRLISDD